MRIVLALAMIGSLIARPARADSLFYNRCRDGKFARAFDGADVVLVGGTGRSCKDLRDLIAAGTAISLALMPVRKILSAPGVGEEIAADLAGMGLTLANPAVLGVTVIGAFGVTVLYFVMRQTLDECEKADRLAFKQEILRELQKNGLRASSPQLQFER